MISITLHNSYDPSHLYHFMFWMHEQQNIVILLCFLGYLCQHSTLLVVLFLPHLLLPLCSVRSHALLLLDRVLESLELSEIVFSNFILLLVFADSLLKQVLQCI